jgi:hypothetical protein
VEIRFPKDAPERERFDEWRAALDAYSSHVRFCHESGRPAVPELVKVDELRRAAAQAADEWLKAARAAVAHLDGKPLVARATSES